MPVKSKRGPHRLRSFTAARRRALARLRKGLDLQWTPPGSREEVHERGSRRHDRRIARQKRVRASHQSAAD
jgi:hypothetical protein